MRKLSLVFVAAMLLDNWEHFGEHDSVKKTTPEKKLTAQIGEAFIGQLFDRQSSRFDSTGQIYI